MVRATQRFSRIDCDATAINAASVLSQYPHRKAMALRWSVALQSPAIDGMPKHESTSNAAEDRIVSHLDDKRFVSQVEYIINQMMPITARDPSWPKIIGLSYMRGLQDTMIQQRLGYSHSAYYEAKKDALCAFAELWPPYPSDLIIYK